VTTRRHPRRGQQGQTSLLIVGFFLVAVLMVVVVVDASAAYLRRQALDSVADGAALAAADGVQGERVYEGGLGERADIDPAVARRYVAEYLAAVGAHSRYPGLGYQVQASTDAVAVRVTAPLDLPFAPPGWEGTTTVTGTAASYVVVTD
jgi:uncharacterized membrane protein